MCFIVRDEEGKNLIASSKRCRGDGSSTLVEALALRFGLETTLLGGLSVHIIESDSERLVRSINGELDDEPYVMSLVEDIKILAADSHCPIVQYAHRNSNKVAHLGRNEPFEEIWTDRLPTCCMNVILNDVRRKPNSSNE
ncbi:hypothetical protein ACS0TY_015293 [Phlomoides rotata]